jgi:hypothetical protein
MAWHSVMSPTRDLGMRKSSTIVLLRVVEGGDGGFT